MKKTVLFLLIITFIIALIPAYAEFSSASYDWEDIELNEATGLMAVRTDYSSGYRIMDVNGNDLLQQSFNSAWPREDFFEVDTHDGVNRTGVIDRNGALIVPCVYTDIDYLSDRWIVAAHVILSDENTHDYIYENWSTNKRSFYIIDYWDVFFNGNKVGSLSRTDYSNAYAYGDYIVVRGVDGNYKAYNSQMVPSSVMPDYSSEYQEKKENGATVFYHVGSGQKAFSPECTLSKEEVESWLTPDKHYNYYDLQGNYVFSAGSGCTYIGRFSNGYAVAHSNVGKGIISDQGEMIVPCEFDSIIGEPSDVRYGYCAVEKDEKFGFVNNQGKVTCDFKYKSSSVRNRGPFAWIADLDGTYILMSAAAGELPEHYADVHSSFDTHAPYIAVKKTDGSVGLIDEWGNDAIPFSKSYRDVYNIQLASDGSVAVVYNADEDTYDIFQMSIDPVPQAEKEVDTIRPDIWICPVCGTECTSNFCPNDGTKRPVEVIENSSWFCPSCGAECTFRFCPNDGTPKPSSESPVKLETKTVLLTELEYTKKSACVLVGSKKEKCYTDVNKTVYSSSNVIHPLDITAYSIYAPNYENEAYVCYYLNKEYSEFSGEVFRPYITLSCTDVWKQNGLVKIYADDKLIFSTEVSLNTYDPIPFTLPVDGVREIRIVITGVWKYGSYIYPKVALGNLQLTT